MAGFLKKSIEYIKKYRPYQSEREGGGGTARCDAPFLRRPRAAMYAYGTHTRSRSQWEHEEPHGSLTSLAAAAAAALRLP